MNRAIIDCIICVIWSWKGDYTNLGAGAETGIYKEGIGPHWFTAPEKAMPMTLELYNKATDDKYFSYSPNEDQWWITGFSPYTFSVKQENLKSITTIDFSTQLDLWDGFAGKYNGNDDRWRFDDATKIATFTWD